MATVYLGRGRGQAGFSRLFAIKVLHPHLAHDRAFVRMLFDEGQIAARLHHPNVVPIIDVGTDDGFQYVVLEYVEGCSLSALLSNYNDIRPAHIVVAIVLDALSGLHAAHVLTDDDGRPMNLVHRDVSPQNVLVGVDGTARLTDFGVAKARILDHETRPGVVKGKLGFLSPEQVLGLEIDHRSDLFSAGCLLWSALTGCRLFHGDSDTGTMRSILEMAIPPPSEVGLKPSPVFDAVCLRALERDPDRRWSSAAEMEDALRKAALDGRQLGSKREVSEWATAALGEELEVRRAAIRAAAASSEEVRRNGGRTPPNLRVLPAVAASEWRLEESSLTTARESTGAIPTSRGGRRGLLIGAGTISITLFASVSLLLRPAQFGKTRSSGGQLTASPLPPSAASSLTPSPVVTVIPRPSASSAAPALAPSTLAPTRAPVRKAPRRGGAAKVNCDPPYVVDATGMEHFKPECL